MIVTMGWVQVPVTSIGTMEYSAALHNDSHLDRRRGRRAKRSTTGYALVLCIERALAHVLGGESFGSALPGRLPGVADEPSSLCTRLLHMDPLNPYGCFVPSELSLAVHPHHDTLRYPNSTTLLLAQHYRQPQPVQHNPRL